MNPNWERWFHASILDYFKKQIADKGLKLEVEAQLRDTPPKEDHAELRWDGPYAREVCRKYWFLDVEINILVTSNLANTDDTHKHKKHVGLVQAAFANFIPVYKYGEGPDDDQSLLGCLQLRVEDREAIMTSYFGKIEVDVVLEQSTVEGHYRMTLNVQE